MRALTLAIHSTILTVRKIVCRISVKVAQYVIAIYARVKREARDTIISRYVQDVAFQKQVGGPENLKLWWLENTSPLPSGAKRVTHP